MKNLKPLLFLLLFCLSFGQHVMGLTVNQSETSGAEIQPVHQNDSGSFPPSSAYLLNSSAQPETIFYHSGQLSPQFAENNPSEEDIRERVREKGAERERKEWLYKAGVIHRSLTFRELIYPYHFYF